MHCTLDLQRKPLGAVGGGQSVGWDCAILLRDTN
jgi:hypothetical protein